MAALSALLLPSLYADPEVVIYQGTPVAEQKITVGGWGSGLASERASSPTVPSFNGTQILQVSTNGYYSGARLDFQQPIDITDALAAPDTYLQFMVWFPNYVPPDDITALSTYGTADLQGAPPTRFVRVVLVVNGQQLMVEDHPVNLLLVENGWVKIAVPLSAFKGTRPTGKAMLSRLLLFGDTSDQFNVGAIETITDNEEIVVEQIDDQAATVFDPTEWVGEASGGLATLEYVWDFDDSDGLQEDALGNHVRHVYRTPKSDPGYTVTLTVRDKYGVKQPVSVTCACDVYPQ
jgi:hypothetical protein